MGVLIGYIAVLMASRSKKSIPMTIIFTGAIIVISLIGFEAKIYSTNPQELPFMPRILEAFSPEGWRTAAIYGRTALINLTIKSLLDSGSLAFGLGIPALGVHHLIQRKCVFWNRIPNHYNLLDK